MKSRWLVNLLLLLLVVTLGFFALSTNDNEAGKPKTVSTINPKSINKITITHNGRVTAIEKANAHWQLTEPLNLAANDFRIGTIIKILDTTSYAKYVANSLDLKKFGLDNPTTSLLLDQTQIDFGIVNPINNYRYIKLNNEVHLIDDYYHPLVSSQIGTLVSRTLLPADSKITRLELPDQTLSLDADDKWHSTKDISIDAIVETINHWRNTEAFGVHDYNDRVPLDAITVTLAGNDKPIVFYISDVEPWLILARPDINLEYHFDLENYDLLLRPGAEKKLPDEFSEQSEQVSPEEFMKALNK